MHGGSDIYTDELRRHARAVEGTGAVPARRSWSFSDRAEPMARLSEPEVLEADALPGGTSLVSDASFPSEVMAQTGSRPAGRRRQAVGAKESDALDCSATLIGPTKPDTSGSILTDDVLGRYAQMGRSHRPRPRSSSPGKGTEQPSGVISKEKKAGLPFPGTWDAVPSMVETRQGRGGDDGEIPGGLRLGSRTG